MPVAIASHVLVFRSDWAFIYCKHPSRLNNVRIMNKLLICMPNLRPRERIVVDFWLFRYVPEAVAVLPPGSDGVGRGRTFRHDHASFQLDETIRKRLHSAPVIWNQHEL